MAAIDGTKIKGGRNRSLENFLRDVLAGARRGGETCKLAVGMNETSFGLPANGRRSPKLRLPTMRKLFCGLRLFRGLRECISEIVYIFIHDESGYRIIQRLLKRRRSAFAMLKARKQLVISKRVHRPLVVSVKLRLIHVGTSWN